MRPTRVALALLSAVALTAPACNDGSQLDGQLVLVTPETRDLKILSVRPESGPLSGGTLLVMTGEGFTTDMVVTFAGVEATQLYVGGDELLALSVPPGAEVGPVDIVATRADEQTATVAGGYTYDPDPAELLVTEVAPDSGPLSDETEVFVVGHGFVEGAKVFFGGNAGTGVRVLSAESLRVVAPPGDALGSVAVRVELPSGESNTLDAGFTYVPDGPTTKLTLLAVIPTEGPLAGGNTLTLEGRGFVDGATVSVGDKPATDLRVLGDTAITCVAPAGNGPGLVDVEVTIPGDDDSVAPTVSFLDEAYRYLPENPTDFSVLGVTPSEGPLVGGNTVTIEGTGFIDGATVDLGSNACTDVRVLGPQAITCTAPAGNGPGVVDVRVDLPTAPGETAPSAFLDAAYTYQPEPASDLTVLAVIPAEGPLAGGQVVAVKGTGFAVGATVRFDGRACTDVQFLGPEGLACRVPAGQTAGAVDVRVELPMVDGVAGDAAVLTDGYTYQPGPPDLLVLRAIPDRGPLSGGNTVTVEGTGFTDGAKVFFGGAQATAVQILAPTALTCTAPAGAAAGTVDLRVELPIPAGEVSGDAYTLEDAYTYELGGTTSDDLTAASLYPGQGDLDGGALVLVTGTGFDPAMAIRFGTTQAPLVQVLSANAATALVPEGDAPGFVDVTLANPNGDQAVLTQGFRYRDPSTVETGEPPSLGGVLPGRGPTTGGTLVRVFGANFAPGLRVWFGDAAAEVEVVNAGLATARVPAGTAGATAVKVANTDDQEDALAAGFTYVAPSDTPPSLDGVWPALGPNTGGTWVVLTGAELTEGSAVWFGMTPATRVWTLGSDRVIAVAPAGEVGSVDITVVRADGELASLVDAFAYYDAANLPSDPPVIGGVTPGAGTIAGGQAVRVVGSGFQAGARVFFGVDEATVADGGTASQRDVTTPAHDAGAASVTVVNPDGLTHEKTNAFVFFSPPPLIQSVTPASGGLSGGYEVTIHGRNFGPDSVVTFGSSTITTFNAADADALTFFAPPGQIGSISVSVTNRDGQLDVMPNGFLYVDDSGADIPTITSVDPTHGPSTGGYLALIRGSTFLPGARVEFGGVPATGVEWLGDGLIKCTVPAGVAETTVDVSIENGPSAADTLTAGFTYEAQTVAPLRILSVSPGVGLTDGGTVITVEGDGFIDGTAVLIGGVEATTVNVISSTTLTAVTPAGDAGLVSVRVERPDLTATTAYNAFAYIAAGDIGDAPRVTAIDPVVGPLTGNSLVLLTGAGFTGQPRVFFGATEAPAVTLVDSTRLAVRTPPRATAGTVAVSAINPDGLVGVLPGAYSYYDATGAAAPEVFITQPGQGSSFGLDTVNVVGDKLQNGARVYFCDLPATVTGLSGDAQLTVLTPAHEPGACGVTVVNPDGLTGDRDEAFEYIAPAPSVTGVIPSAGPKDGGIDVVVQGDNFVPGATVRFGLATSPVVVVADQRTLTARLPSNNVGVVDVTVINPGAAQAQGTLEDAFTYVDDVSGVAPTITNVFPGSGPLSGGTPVRVLGTAFDPAAIVIFDGALLPGAMVASDTEIRFDTPSRTAPGPVSITILNPDGLGATRAEGFVYAPPSLPAPQITTLVPSSGPEAGGNTLTVTGANFRATGTWTLDGRTLAAATVTESLVTAQVPAHLPGRVDLVYIGPDGQVAVKPQAYEYVAAPVLTSVVPDLGPLAGDTDVTLVGDHFANGMQVLFNGVPGQVLLVQAGGTTASARTPPSVVAGDVDVVVRNPDGQEGKLVKGFEYLAAPDVQTVWPVTGPDTGGTLVQIRGNGFHAQSRVFFGPNESADVYYKDPGLLLAFAPEATVTLVGVRVLNPDEQEATLADAFTYVDADTLDSAPFITTIYPERGPMTGGTRVGIDGTNFDSDGRAVFVPSPATPDFVRGDRAIVPAPPGEIGPAAVYWVNPDGQTVRSPVDFTYLDPAALGSQPTIGSLAPVTGPTAGNTPVALLGAGFQNNARVRFGPDDATGVSWTPTALEVKTPARVKGSVAVWVINPDGTQAQAPATYLYLAPPTILGMSPNRGPASGGTTITLNGVDLLEDPDDAKPTVLFCDDYAAGSGCDQADPTTVTVSGDGRQLTVDAPAHPPGIVDVAVVAPDGQSDVTESAFTYTQLPTVSDIDPDSGPTTGGQTLGLTGTGYQVGVKVYLDGAQCTDVVLSGGMGLTCKTPSGTTGPADLRVLNPDGGSLTITDAYTYLPPPVIDTIVPNLAPEGQQVETAIQGLNFSPQAKVFFDTTEVPAGDIISRTSTLIRLRVPLLDGSVDVIVRNPDGQEARKIDGFSYIPPLPPPSALYILPRTGLTYGGDAFKIAGSNFLDGVIVEFGKAPDWVAAPPEQIQVKNNGTLITGLSPQHAQELVDVRITNSDGQSVTLTDAFEFVAPPDEQPLGVISMEPPRSVIGGGGWLTISGTGFRVNVQVTFVQGNQSLPSPVVQRFGPTLMRAQIPPAPQGVAGDATIIVTNPATYDLPQEIYEVSDFFEYFAGPVFERHPGDRLPNERTGDIGAFVFDANGDELDDVLVFNSSRNYLLINGWGGRAGFFSERNFSNIGGTRNAYAFDADSDGDQDLVLHNGGTLYYCPNNGGGEFGGCSSISSSCSSNDFEVGDLNCDGREDFFMGCTSTGQDNAIILNLGDGRFSQTSVPLPNDRENTRGAALGDVDGDGDTDILLAQNSSTINRLYLNNCADLQLGGECQMAIPNAKTSVFDGHTYSMSNDSLSNPAAHAVCRSFKYDGLVRVDSAEENDFIRNDPEFINQYFWIGYYDDDGDKSYDWLISGGDAGYTDGWCSGEPNNADNYACAYYQWSSSESSRCWRDTTCESGYVYMCESHRPPCSSPWTFSNVDYGTTFPYSSGDARDAALVDIDEDGRLDAIIAFYGQATRVYMNTGATTQGGELFLDSFVRWPQEDDTDLDELIPVDVDGDSDVDIVGRKNYNEVRLYINDRFIVTYKQFGCDPATEDCSCNPCAGETCERVEVNGSGAYSNQTAERWPDGNGKAWRTDLSSNYRPFGIGDLDGDQLPDFYAAGSSNADRMIFNCGYEDGLPWVDQSRVPIGSFRFNTFRALPETRQRTRDSVVADFNGDGDPDIMRCGDNMRPTLWLNDGAAKWYDATDPAMPSESITCYPNAMAAADLDNDGDLDVIIEGEGKRMQLVNDGFGNFADQSELNISANIPSRGTNGVLIADLDNDGDQDWFVVGDDYYAPWARVFINGGDAFNVGGAYGIDRSNQWLSGLDPGYRVATYDAAIIDINGDAFPDLYLGVSGVNRALLNVDGQYFVEAQSSAVPPGPFVNESGYSTRRILASDFDDDGDNDIVDVVSGRNRYQVRDGSNGYFDVTPDTMPNVSATSYGGDIGDIDLDGLPDVYITNNGQDYVFLSNGNGFTDVSEGLPYIPHNSYSGHLVDIDGDCDLDVIVLNDLDQDRIYINTLDLGCP